MRVAVAGATGLIGRALVRALRERGDEVVPLSRGGRDVEGVAGVRWDARGPLPLEALVGLDAIVNLVGEPLAGKRWTADRKREIRRSRLDATRALAALAGGDGPPVLVNASGVDYYGDRESVADEHAPAGAGFLAELCVEWEAAARTAEGRGARVVMVRSGMVLSRHGGALPQLARPARLGLNGPIGGGRQWVSWIHIDDEVGLLLHALDDVRLSGPLNAASPSPVRQRELASTLGRVLRRPAAAPAPAVALRLLFGEMADVILEGRPAVPRAALAAGYRFRYERLEPALRAELAA